jgi:RNA polymerase sigma-70 factor, ECF subfamily
MLTPAELVWLLASVAKGDQAAFERLYAATRAKLYGVVLRILRRADLADEVMQDSYLKIWRSAGDFDPRVASPMTWMVAIARTGRSTSSAKRRKCRSKRNRQPWRWPETIRIRSPAGRLPMS